MPRRTTQATTCPPTGTDPALWMALVEDAGVALKVSDAEGVLVYSNVAYAELVGADSAARLVGKNTHSYLPAGFAAEVQGVARAVALSGKPAMVRTIWHGRPVVALVRVLRPVPARPPWVITVVRAELPSDSSRRAGFRFVQSVYADEGPIAVLSARERSVLSLIGAGMSTAQIAKALDRSVKTIENQRHSMGRKLKVSNRVELARIALAYGLSLPAGNHEPRRRALRRNANA